MAINLENKYWKEVSLEEISEMKYGKMPKKEDIVEKGYPIYSGYRVTGYCKDYMFEDPQLIVVARGVGGTGDVKLSPPKCFLTNLSIAVMLDETIALKEYLYYYFQILNLRNLDTGSAQSQITIADLKRYKVILPPIIEQKLIADTLSSIDDKIELNNRMNKALEKMVQAIFISWFVDFEPLKEGEFEDSELGKIPKGWRVGSIGEFIADTVGGDWGKETPQGNYTEEVICIRGADIPEIASGKTGKPPVRFILKTNAEKKQLSPGQIIIEISGGSPTQSTGRTAFINEELVASVSKPFICTNFCRALLLKKDQYSPFVYSMLQYLYHKDVFFLYENGTTGIKNLDIKNLLTKQLIVIPDDATIVEFKGIFNTILKSIYENGNQSEKLANVRDNLLPKLINGEIRVPISDPQ